MLIQGADGVFIGGCHLGDCHYIKGNYYAEKRYDMTKKLLAKTGMNPDRLQLKWISAAEGQLFADTMREVTEVITKLGPSPVAGEKPDMDILEKLLIIRNAAEDYRLRVLIGKGISLVDEFNVYREPLDPDRFQELLDEAIEEEYVRSSILFHTREEAQSVVDIAEKINVPSEIVLQHVVTLKDRDLIRMERIDGDTPYYQSQVHNLNLSEQPDEATEPLALIPQLLSQPPSPAQESEPPPVTTTTTPTTTSPTPVPALAPDPSPAPEPTPEPTPASTPDQESDPKTETKPTGGE
jgi:hypothetical protein